MKAIGVVRKVDKLGRIVLPKELRNIFAIDHNDPLQIFVEDDQIVLKKYQPGCQECGKLTDIVSGSNTVLCRKCLQAMNVSTNLE